MAQEPFLWGVATAAYQVEGGLNGPGQPANNWAPWDRGGRVEPVGVALRFWEEPEELLDRAAAMGCNAFRLSVEWARVQPAAQERVSAEPAWDEGALDRYAEILASCRARGLEPVVTLHHFTHPLWCGRDFWLAPDAPARFEAYARRCVRELGRRLAEAGEAPVRWWLTLNEPAAVAGGTYALRVFPGGARGRGPAHRAHDHLLAAHVRAYDAIHDVYAEEGWGEPLVSVNTISMTIAALDALVVDALLARERGVGRSDLRGYLDDCHHRSRARVAAVPRRWGGAWAVDVVLDRLARPIGPRAEDAVFRDLYASPRPRKLDYLAFDYYDPVAGHWVRPAHPEARPLRRLRWGAELWEQVPAPDGLAVFLRQAHLQAPGRPILVAENGMCTPGARPRPDGQTRDRFLEAMCREVVRAREEGIPVAGYLHWTVADNYEWGSYAPRFGLHGVDRSDPGRPRILPTDAVGVDAAGAYAALIAADRAHRPPDGSGASAL